MQKPIVVVFLFLVMACSSGASDTIEAAKRLTTPKQWQIQEILIDDAPVFKDGRHVEHISGIVFDNYMDWVRFDKNGRFEGHFNYKPAHIIELFEWASYPKQNVIALRDTINKTGGWNIYPVKVKHDAFEMEVHSSAYDPPRMTKITLKFGIKNH